MCCSLSCVLWRLLFDDFGGLMIVVCCALFVGCLLLLCFVCCSRLGVWCSLLSFVVCCLRCCCSLFGVCPCLLLRVYDRWLLCLG